MKGQNKMDKKTIELTKEQLNNLRVFLERVDIKGVEAPMFIELMKIIVQGQQDKKDK